MQQDNFHVVLNSHHRNNLLDKIAAITNDQLSKKVVLDNAPSGDKAVMNALLKYVPRETNAKRRATNRAKDISRLLQSCKIQNITTMLDVGADDASITKAVDHELQLDQAHAVDIPMWEGKERPKINGIPYHHIDPITNKIPYPSGSFDMVIAMQSLHHVRNLPQMMYEINRVLKTGGTVVIREHDCNSGLTARLIDLEHLLYTRGVNYDSFTRGPQAYYAKYRSRDMWSRIFQSHMFYPVKCGVKHKLNSTRCYYAVFKKAANAKPISSYNIDALQSIYSKVCVAKPNHNSNDLANTTANTTAKIGGVDCCIVVGGSSIPTERPALIHCINTAMG